MVNINDNLKILCVDDEQDVLFIVSTALKQEGYEVFTATHGQEGLDVARKELPDAIVLDVMMPKMNGFEVLEKLNEGEDTRKIPVVMLTGLSEKTKKQEAIDSGIRFYMVKPFEPHELIAKVQLAIKTAHQGEDLLG